MTHCSYQNDCEVDSFFPKTLQPSLHSVLPFAFILILNSQALTFFSLVFYIVTSDKKSFSVLVFESAENAQVACVDKAMSDVAHKLLNFCARHCVFYLEAL